MLTWSVTVASVAGSYSAEECDADMEEGADTDKLEGAGKGTEEPSTAICLPLSDSD